MPIRRKKIAKNNPRKRRRNPWTKLQFGLVGVGVVVVGIALRYAIMKNAEKLANADAYYYWAEQKPVTSLMSGGEWVPKIQNAKTGEVFALPDEITEQGALWAAEKEIKKRGGIPQQGQPI